MPAIPAKLRSRKNTSSGSSLRHLANNHASCVHLARFVVVPRNAVVADVWRGERDDLTGVTGVGDHLLVSTQTGVKDHFAGSDTQVSANRFTLKHAAVGEQQVRRPHAHSCSSPLRRIIAAHRLRTR
jgi:hypothetical protein